MTPSLEKLHKTVSTRLRQFGFSKPSGPIIRSMLQVAFQASMRTEEGVFSKPSMTFAVPSNPDPTPPFTTRADYPSFCAFGGHHRLSVDVLVKLSRAVDQWSSSLAIYGQSAKDLYVWGVVDQLVQQSVRVNREDSGGFDNPGILTINVDGIGAVSAYFGSVFLGAIRDDQLVVRENDALSSRLLSARIAPFLGTSAAAISHVLKNQGTASKFLSHLFYGWGTLIARLCIGLRKMRAGGAFLITPSPVEASLQHGIEFGYKRLGDSLVLQVLDAWCQRRSFDECRACRDPDVRVLSSLYRERSLAEADHEDRVSEVTGAVKLVTSLAALDGLVLLTPQLHVARFGVKIGNCPDVGVVCDGANYKSRALENKVVDTSAFGTRHGSMLRYCSLDRDAIGVVVSQDGQVRLIMTDEVQLVMWNNVKLLGHTDYSGVVVADHHSRMARRKDRQEVFKRGYTAMPKSVEELHEALRDGQA